MKDINIICSDILLEPRVREVLGVNSDDPTTSLYKLLEENDVVDIRSFKEWIKEYIGKLCLMPILEKIGIDFDKRSNLIDLISTWFSYRQIGESIPSARPMQLASNVLELARQARVEPDKVDAIRLLNAHVELMMRYIVFYYFPEHISEAVADENSSKTTPQQLEEYNVIDFCNIITKKPLAKAEPYNNDEKNILLVNEEIAVTLDEISNLTENYFKWTHEQTLSYSNLVIQLIEYWLNVGQSCVIPKGVCVAETIQNAFNKEMKCFDEDGHEIILTKFKKLLEIGDTTLLCSNTKQRVVALNLAALPMSPKWVMPQTSRLTATKKKKKIFFSYSRSDRSILDEFKTHFNPLRDQGIVDFWDDTQLDGGDDVHGEIVLQLQNADIFICLISPDFMNTSYIWEKELEIARQYRKTVIPITVRSVDYKERFNSFFEMERQGYLTFKQFDIEQYEPHRKNDIIWIASQPSRARRDEYYTFIVQQLKEFFKKD